LQNPQALTTFGRINSILHKYQIDWLIAPVADGQFTLVETGQEYRIFHYTAFFPEMKQSKSANWFIKPQIRI